MVPKEEFASVEDMASFVAQYQEILDGMELSLRVQQNFNIDTGDAVVCDLPIFSQSPLLSNCGTIEGVENLQSPG